MRHVEQVEPSLSATVIVAAMPVQEWLTEAQVAALPQTQMVLRRTGRTLRSALGEARRRGWVIRNPNGSELRWTKTPKGSTQTTFTEGPMVPVLNSPK